MRGINEKVWNSKKHVDLHILRRNERLGDRLGADVVRKNNGGGEGEGV